MEHQVKNTIVIIMLVLCLPVFCAASRMSIRSGMRLTNVQYSAGPYIALLLEYPNGQKLGYDSIAGKNIGNNTDESSYGEDGIDSLYKVIDIMNPPEGSYNLSLASNETGIFWLKVYFEDGVEYTDAKIWGIIGKGEIQGVAISYTNNENKVSSIKKKVTAEFLRQETNLCFENKLIDEGTHKTVLNKLKVVKDKIKHKQLGLAEDNVSELSGMLKEKYEKYVIKDANDIENIEYWFSADSEAVKHIQKRIERHDANILDLDVIKPERKRKWLSMKAVEILYRDLDTFKESLETVPNGARKTVPGVTNDTYIE